MKIVIINGQAQAGKDTFVQFAYNYQSKKAIEEPERQIKVYNISSVDFVKDVARFAGWNGIKDERGRQFLSDLKDCMTLYDDIPIKKIKERINHHLNTLKKLEIPTKNTIFFIHVREPLEIARLAKEFNALTLFIQRPGLPQYENHADKEVGIYNYDVHYWNVTSLEDMPKNVYSFLDSLLITDWYSEHPDLNIWDLNTYPKNQKPSLSINDSEWANKLP